MPRVSHAKSTTQAERAVRHAQADGAVASLGTARDYRGALARAADWDVATGGTGRLRDWTPERAMQYLTDRSAQVRQSTLDQDRQALAVLPQVGELERIHSEVGGHGRLATEGRAPTAEQVQMVAARQSERNALATEVAHAGGLRAHELHTLRRADERPATADRPWRADRYAASGQEVRYTVVGKGGLTREVALPRELADRLEARRLPEPVRVTDREVVYRSVYDISGGQSWSQSYSRTARSALGWSTGAHGLRHAYAQRRMDQLQGSGYRYDDARAVVSQELGHWRSSITETYLR